MDILELILLLLVKITHLGEDLRVSWNLGHQNIVPFECLSSHTNQFVDMCNLIDDLVTIWDDGMKLFESLKRFIVVVESLVHKTQVVDSFNAISLNTNRFKEEFLCSVIVFSIVEAVTFVY